jgi:hypothetical protein
MRPRGASPSTIAVNPPYLAYREAGSR